MTNTLKYPINNIYGSIQGEGVMTGVPMVILRLQGCNVGCPWCDTKDTWELREDDIVHTWAHALGQDPLYVFETATEIASFIHSRWSTVPWVLVTGGEPALYPLRTLVEVLHVSGKQVALETSGTELGHICAGFDWVCVSPKIGMPGGKEIQPVAVRDAHEIKFPVGKSSDIDDLQAFLRGTPTTRDDVVISLQPLSQSKFATQLCFQAAMKFGWRVSIQVHKLVDMP